MMNNGTAYAPEPPKKSSTGKILVFAGIGCAGLILVAIVVIGALIWGGVNKIANSEGAQVSKAFVANSPEAQTALGTPIDSSFSGGNFNVNNGTGDAEVRLTSTGPKGTGHAVVELHCVNNGPWSVVSARLDDAPGGGTIKLK